MGQRVSLNILLSFMQEIASIEFPYLRLLHWQIEFLYWIDVSIIRNTLIIEYLHTARDKILVCTEGQVYWTKGLYSGSQEREINIYRGGQKENRITDCSVGLTAYLYHEMIKILPSHLWISLQMLFLRQNYVHSSGFVMERFASWLFFYFRSISHLYVYKNYPIWNEKTRKIRN